MSARVPILKGVLVEEHRTMMLGNHVEVLRQGVVDDTSRSFLHADNVPWTVQVARHCTRVTASYGSRVPRENLEHLRLSSPGRRADCVKGRSTEDA